MHNDVARAEDQGKCRHGCGVYHCDPREAAGIGSDGAGGNDGHGGRNGCVVANHISMGNSVKVYEVSREYGELVYVDINQGNTRKYVHSMMQNRMRSRSGMLV